MNFYPRKVDRTSLGITVPLTAALTASISAADGDMTRRCDW